MGWKNWPYWLRGGIISLAIYILVSLILLPIPTDKIAYQSPFPIWTVPSVVGLIGVFFYGLIFNLHGFDLREQLPLLIKVTLITAIIIYFLIGALIGWIIGKIKSKKEQKVE